MVTPRQCADDRGVFLEWFRGDLLTETSGTGSTSSRPTCRSPPRGTMRGIHFADVPPGQAKYVTVLSGAALDVVVDIRVGSPTFGRWDSVLLDAVDRRAVYLAEGLGHVFMALEDGTTAMYLCSAAYNPAASTASTPSTPRSGWCAGGHRAPALPEGRRRALVGGRRRCPGGCPRMPGAWPGPTSSLSAKPDRSRSPWWPAAGASARTAAATVGTTRSSKTLGTISSAVGEATRSAMAQAAASFIASLTRVRRSSAPRKTPGNASTLLIWFGKSLRPVATTAAYRRATSGCTSGSGLARPKTIASGAIAASAASGTVPP